MTAGCKNTSSTVKAPGFHCCSRWYILMPWLGAGSIISRIVISSQYPMQSPRNVNSFLSGNRRLRVQASRIYKIFCYSVYEAIQFLPCSLQLYKLLFLHLRNLLCLRNPSNPFINDDFFVIDNKGHWNYITFTKFFLQFFCTSAGTNQYGFSSLGLL